MAQKISARTETEFARCRCCGVRVKSDFAVCVGCLRKREKVLQDCLSAGKSEKWARERVNEVYPFKFVK